MRFANPSAFDWLWLIPALILLAGVVEYRGRNVMKKAFGTKIAPFLTSSVSLPKRRLKFGLKLLALIFFIIAWAQPQMGKSMQEVKARGIEVMAAVDVSTSMLAEDVKPSRLQFAKSELGRLLDALSGDKVGLVAFAGSSVLISPLTNDKSALKMFVDSLSTQSVENQGTDVARALDESRKAFEHGGAESDDTSKVTRVILILSDGEDHEEGAIAAAKKLAADGTRIFTIAIGTEKGAPIPLRDDRGFLEGYKRDHHGQNVLSTVKGDFLRELAEVGHGSFHHASFGVNEASQIKAEFDKLQQAEFASSMATNYDERFQLPLLIGILLGLLDLCIGEKKGEGRIWRGRFEVSQS